MRKGGGKAKGASFERDICRQLSLWVSKGTQEDCFWRSAMSGGRATVAHAKGKRLAAQAGDISCVHPTGAPLVNRFFMECKFYASLDFAGLLTDSGNLVKFWKEAVDQSLRYDKEPMLIAKQNRLNTVFCLNMPGVYQLGLDWRKAELASPKLDIYIFDAEWFLNNALPPGR